MGATESIFEQDALTDDGSRRERSRFKSRRERAAEMRARMEAFAPIYNAAWMVRDTYFGPDKRRQEKTAALMSVLLELARQSSDHEALLFAVADALYSSPSGVPWEA